MANRLFFINVFYMNRYIDLVIPANDKKDAINKVKTRYPKYVILNVSNKKIPY